MKKEFVLNLDEDILLRFNMALQLNNENVEEVFESFMKKYFVESFSKEASGYGGKEISIQPSPDEYYGKALNKISKWAGKPHQINYKILRAFLQLEGELEAVTYDNLMLRCNNQEKHYDVYVPTFSSNFEQMKIDAEKSHGKVFVVDENGVVTLWNYIADEVKKYKNDFLKLHSTDIGYINEPYKQEVIRRTDKIGTDHCSKIYIMRCTHCNTEYEANSTDLFQKKCPNCQGGADTGNKK